MPTPTLDFETYSEAGHAWNPATRKWELPPGARKKGISAVGSSAYTEHPTTEVLTASYNLCDGRGIRRWRPGQPAPLDLFAHIARPGAVLESHKAMFEFEVWTNVCIPRYGWPRLPPYVQRCSMALAHVNQYPGALDNLGAVLRLEVQKDTDGTRLIKKFCIPRNPTKTDPRTRIRPEDDPEDFERLCAYCDRDVTTEMAAADAMPPLTTAELGFWLIDQECNARGLAIDREGVRDCISILNQVISQYGEECRVITGGIGPTQVEATRGWLAAQGVHLHSLDADAVESALARENLPYTARRVLELRALTGSASVKKILSMENQASRDNRLRNLIVHHGARTGRPTGEGPQPLNLPKAGPKLATCGLCARPHRVDAVTCPWCGAVATLTGKPKWSHDFVEPVLSIMAFRSLDMVERFFGDALLCIMGCVRGLFVAAPGHDLIASDYSAIEAVVAAMLAGEQWRIDAFRHREPIYLVGASKITGKPLQFYLDYFLEHGEHHPDRQYIGKVSELACGFGGWIGSYKAFGSTEPDDVIKAQILAWRAASPAIVEAWGGQFRGMPWDRNRRPELFGLEGMMIAAIQAPGVKFEFRGIGFQWVDFETPEPAARLAPDGQSLEWYQPEAHGGRLMVTLLSGRLLTYHDPRLRPSDRFEGQLSISYMTWNTNPKYGALGWVRMETYGGRLFENVVQATAHCIQRHGIILLRAARYPLVLGVYDEDVLEVPEGFGSVDEVERLMGTMPSWAHGWPVYAAGGWRAKRYRKG
jgi:DNA polymerase